MFIYKQPKLKFYTWTSLEMRMGIINSISRPIEIIKVKQQDQVMQARCHSYLEALVC